MTTGLFLDNHLEHRHRGGIGSTRRHCMIMWIFLFVAAVSCGSFMGQTPWVNLIRNDKWQNRPVDGQTDTGERRDIGGAYFYFYDFLPLMDTEKMIDDECRRGGIDTSFIGVEKKTWKECGRLPRVEKGCLGSDLISVVTNSAWMPILRFLGMILVSAWHGLFVAIFRRFPNTLDICTISLTRGIIILTAMTSAVTVLKKLFLTTFGCLFDVVAAFWVSHLMFGTTKMTRVRSGGILEIFCLRGNRRGLWQSLKWKHDLKPPRIAVWLIGGDWVSSLMIVDACWSDWGDLKLEEKLRNGDECQRKE